MRLYFKHVIFGVLIRPKKAIEYVVNNSTPFSLTLLILFSIFAGMGVLGVNGLRMEKNLFIANYLSDNTMKIFLFGLLFLLLYLFNKIMRTKAIARDILYVTLLTGIASVWITFFTLITFTIIAFINNGSDFVLPNNTFIGVGFILTLVLLTVYHMYIVVQLLNRVQKVSMKKSVTVVLLTALTLMLMVGISKYFEKEQQNLALSLFQTLSKNTDNNASKSTY